MLSADGLTETTVNLVPAAREALEVAAERLGETRTEALNRALQLYEAVTGADVGTTVEFEIEPGFTRALVVQR